MTTGFNSTGQSANGITGAIALTRQTIDNGYATAIGNGDPVAFASGYIVSCAEDAVPVGILRGIQYIDANGEYRQLNSYPASTTNTGSIDGITDVVALIEPVQDRLFYIQAADAAVSQASIGTVKRVKSLGRDATTGRSTAVVDMDASVTTETRLVEIVDLFRRQGNAFGSNVDVLVKFVEA